jgi:agmatine deiminase
MTTTYINKETQVRTPAEWLEQKAVWLSFPHNKIHLSSKLASEPDKDGLTLMKEFFWRFIDIVLDYQDIKLLFDTEAMLMENIDKLTSFAAKPFKLISLVIPNNDIWIRDFGPIFAIDKETEEKIVVDFAFNAWGEKFPPWDKDNVLPTKVGELEGLTVQSYDKFLEGGAIDYSEKGYLLTTRQCVLNTNRNKNFTEKDFEELLFNALGIKQVIWLDKGIANDHTDGHVDNTARFIDDERVVLSYTENPVSPNYEISKENFKTLEAFSDLEVIKLPLPEPEGFIEKALAYSYANFVFLNGAIIVPTYNCPQDQQAIDILQKLFPDRKVIGFDSSLVIQQGGSLHCMSKQEFM